VTFPLAWPEKLYGLILLAYTRRFRERHEHEMRLVFRELLHDASYSRARLVRLVLIDLVNGLRSPDRLPSRDLVLWSGFFGVLIVVFSISAQIFHPGRYLGFPVVAAPFVAFIGAGFWGSRRTHSIAGGMCTCLVIGLVASSMLLWDKLLFGFWYYPDSFSFVMSIAMQAAFCLLPGLVGALIGAALPRRNSAPQR